MSEATASDDLARRLLSEKLVAIIRAPDAATATRQARELHAAGIGLVEISLSTPGALDAIATTAAAALAPAMIGVGTVLSDEQLHLAADAGAQFAVTPTTNVAVLSAAQERGMPVVAGAATPTEIHLAISHGAAAVKLFPASQWTLRAFADIRQVFPDVVFVPTGGVDVEQAPRWLGAGAAAVGIGSALTHPDAKFAEIIAAVTGESPDQG